MINFQQWKLGAYRFLTCLCEMAMHFVSHTYCVKPLFSYRNFIFLLSCMFPWTTRSSCRSTAWPLTASVRKKNISRYTWLYIVYVTVTSLLALKSCSSFVAFPTAMACLTTDKTGTTPVAYKTKQTWQSFTTTQRRTCNGTVQNILQNMWIVSY